MNIYVVIGIIGLISSFVAALADVPLVNPKEKYNQIPGKSDTFDNRLFDIMAWNHCYCGKCNHLRGIAGS